MAGKSDDIFTAEGGLALVLALRSVGRDPEATSRALDEAEAAFKAVLNRNKRTDKPEKPATKGQN
jgi:hypothetical protein